MRPRPFSCRAPDLMHSLRFTAHGCERRRSGSLPAADEETDSLPPAASNRETNAVAWAQGGNERGSWPKGRIYSRWTPSAGLHVLSHRKNISIKILEPGDPVSGRGRPDSALLILDERILFQHDAASL